MKILLVAATPFELAPLQQWLGEHTASESPLHFTHEKTEISLLITGVGIMHTTYHLMRYLRQQPNPPSLAINAGVAGAFQANLSIGDVVHVSSERFGDLGAEAADSRFIDIQELGLLPPNELPFADGWLHNADAAQYAFLPTVKGLTVNKVHGAKPSIQAIRHKYSADVESMEGAAFFYTCLMEKIPFLEIRAISNYVEPRNRENWNLPLALDKLNHTLIQLLQQLMEA